MANDDPHTPPLQCCLPGIRSPSPHTTPGSSSRRSESPSPSPPHTPPSPHTPPDSGRFYRSGAPSPSLSRVAAERSRRERVQWSGWRPLSPISPSQVPMSTSLEAVMMVPPPPAPENGEEHEEDDDDDDEDEDEGDSTPEDEERRAAERRELEEKVWKWLDNVPDPREDPESDPES